MPFPRLMLENGAKQEVKRAIAKCNIEKLHVENIINSLYCFLNPRTAKTEFFEDFICEIPYQGRDPKCMEALLATQRVQKVKEFALWKAKQAQK